MKITLVISTLNPGGAERVMATLANAWVEAGEDVSLVTFEPPHYSPFYPLHSKVKLCNLDFLNKNKQIFFFKIGNVLRRLFVLRQTFKKQKPDLILSFMDTVNITVIIAAMGLKVPVVISERIDPKHHSIGAIKKLLCKIIYPLAQHLVVQTSQVLNYFPIHLHNRISIIPNPVLIPSTLSLEKKINYETKCIIAIGRLEKQKGFDLLLQAFADIHSKYSGWELVIWGEGCERQSLEKLRNQLGLQNHVHFPGITHDIYSELSKGSLFVLSSRFEGFPNALCEAMAVGLPVIAFDCGSGPIDIIRDQIDGLLVPPENINALSIAMQQLMDNIELRKKFGERAREIVLRFTLEKIMNKWNTINQLLTKRVA